MGENIEYNVGDVVRVKDKQWYFDNRDQCGKINHSDHDKPFNCDMADYCGGTYIIGYVYDCKESKYYSLIDVKHPNSEIYTYDFANYMFEPEIIKSYNVHGLSHLHMKNIIVNKYDTLITYPHRGTLTLDDNLVGVWGNDVIILDVEILSLRDGDVFSIRKGNYKAVEDVLALDACNFIKYE